jgi:hypothetical protein
MIIDLQTFTLLNRSTAVSDCDVVLIPFITPVSFYPSIVVVMKPTSVALRLTGFLQRYEYTLPSHMTGDYSFDRLQQFHAHLVDQEYTRKGFHQLSPKLTRESETGGEVFIFFYKKEERMVKTKKKKKRGRESKGRIETCYKHKEISSQVKCEK